MIPDRPSQSAYLKRVFSATLVVSATAMLVALMWRARLALLVIYLSVLVAAGLARPVAALESWHVWRGRSLPRWLAALIIYVVTLAMVSGLLVLVLNPLLTQAEQLWTGLPQQFDRLQDGLRHYGFVARRVTLQEAVQNVPKTETGSYGIASTSELLAKGLSKMSAIVEKPKPEEAPSTLGVVGRYILSPRIFHFLENLRPGAGREIQLTDAIGRLLREEAVLAYEFQGKRYDCGSKIGYLQATVNYALKHPELASDFRAFLATLSTQGRKT